MKIKLDTAHWRKPLECYHGPTTWPWWKLFAITYVRLGIQSPSTGHRLWLYTRGDVLVGEAPSYFQAERTNRGRLIDIFFDRRK